MTQISLRAETPRSVRISPKEQEWVRLFNELHTAAALMSGIDLGVVCGKRPSGLPPPTRGERYAAFSWPGARKIHLVPIEEDEDGVRLLKRLLKGVQKEDVVLATPRLPDWLWKLLNSRGYVREIDRRQHEGWLAESPANARWYLDNEPTYEPSIALLPERRAPSLVEGDCLLLAELNYQWYVLSEIGARGRTGTPELLAGRDAWFVEKGPAWRGFRVRLRGMANATEIGDRWGSVAAERARADARSLIVTVEKWRPGQGP